MDISIIIATYKRIGCLAKTLESLCQMDLQGISCEILLVDNACEKETQVVVQQYQSKLPITYYQEKKCGKNYALNAVLPLAKGNLIVFTDDDIVADRNWIRELWEGAARWPDHHVFGGQIRPLWPDGKEPAKDIEPQILWFAYSLAAWDLNEGLYDAEKVYGPNMAIRKQVFDNGYRFNTQIGPSGKNYIMGSETELTKRLESDGMRSVYLPTAIVDHQISKEQMRPRWLNQRAFRCGRHEAYYRKCPDAAMLFHVPRYLYRQLIELFFKRINAFLSFNEAMKINWGFRYWMIKGSIYQYQKTNTDQYSKSNLDREYTHVKN